MKRKNEPCWGGQIDLLGCDDVVEFWKDDAQNPEVSETPIGR
ncbi:hypothetical protein MAXJ12_19493 [Mesorhizobium alhagi CCNWXJ12-2]|uniref:Uncharacterized protein n=1 Tax=Mesorhizobium alhagi CCNWXJ12-2 TaxID=1107882 RepID=H0HUN9_9HYPH|nr:hypothetical protein MAXJ12_19493 [Mesorhizobium alhagi CCNWXJ12-2]